jgi:hypothetical protein
MADRRVHEVPHVHHKIVVFSTLVGLLKKRGLHGARCVDKRTHPVGETGEQGGIPGR